MGEVNARIVVVGAGLGGALMACYLARRGYDVAVYERRPDPRSEGFVGGRSINLALSTRGIHALQQVGLAEIVLKHAVPMYGRMIHSIRGGLAFQRYSKNPTDAIHSVSRAGLNIALLDAAEAHPNVRFYFQRRVEDVDLDAPAAVLCDETSDQTVRVECDLVVGADGAYSAVRARLQRLERVDYSQAFLEHGYKELSIPPTERGEFAIDPNALHIWPRGGDMMLALPNLDRSFTCTLFWPYEGPNGFARLQSAEAIRAHFMARYGDAVPLMPTLVEDFLANPVGSLVTIRCSPWHYGGNVVLIGDAAHAIVPFFGQGMNAAFEDCHHLDACLAAHADDRSRALAAFSKGRQPNADAIADLALGNFIEMRDHTASLAFRIRKRTERVLHRLFPVAFVPLYNMISFSTIPYAEAKRRGRRQLRLLRALGAGTAVIVVVFLVLIGRWILQWIAAG